MPKQENFPLILSLKEGDDLFQSIMNYASYADLKSAIISGLGALSNVIISYYHRDTQQHFKKLFQDTYEIASLTGNLTLVDTGLFIHIHAALGDANFQLFGGHLISAEASASTEIIITPLNYTVLRKKHPDLDIKVICPFVTI
ncbi:Predicted DNA-binding protein with PD1-like DNA-binding motif [Legionella busanensis]|uniref:Predicted DNA-binding protein with PD1-like DNA-binding motif n=1 Tax=Legionella busanensis TaxID=190655 RepID=A0A378JQD6_9GAMM|nr:PPC domain-containing DNA-binding protein [Legionella busanensis]STX52473.1 Predicted DNA-binding protein with PD1-like DNA-binding motif [Legionella busanensis]